MRYNNGSLEVCSGAGGWVEQLNAGSDIIEQIANGDGAGSGLDADRLDGLNSTQFMRTDAIRFLRTDFVWTEFSDHRG